MVSDMARMFVANQEFHMAKGRAKRLIQDERTMRLEKQNLVQCEAQTLEYALVNTWAKAYVVVRYQFPNQIYTTLHI